MLYQPREDSFLLAQQVKKYACGNVLDMGTGSGIQAVTAAESKKVTAVVGVDIDKNALVHCKKSHTGTAKKFKKLSWKHSNLFSNIKGTSTFDTIIFNPPYLPNPEQSYARDIALDGGKKGYELLEKFLKQASRFLKPEGNIVVLFSSLTNKQKVEDVLEEHAFVFGELDRKKYAFEELYVYLVGKSELLKALEKKKVKNIKRLTRGKRGVIYTGKLGEEKIATKTQRQDVTTSTIGNEVTQLKKLNKKGIGPELLFSGKNFFAYLFVEGDFLVPHIEKKSKKKVFAVFTEIFNQMRLLDKLNLNKEEMHHPYKHVLINKNGKVTLLDFERCKTTLKPHNVTQFCQCLSSTVMQNVLKKKKIVVNVPELRKLAKKYSITHGEEEYKEILKLLA
jgi:HemK-related putative methylase